MLKVIELFAGVGGFRIGLSKASNAYKFVWSNQWEPTTKAQDASDIYKREFKCQDGSLADEDDFLYEEHSNLDIATVPVENIPMHDMLVGGFPCQDYSVASTLSRSGGIEGKKGVLWWSIYNIIKNHRTPAKYLFLENVDRLLGSPAKQRGRDFAIILASLAEQGYVVEWRVINAGDYGLQQRRRRTYILAYKKDTQLAENILESDPIDWLMEKGTIAKAFPVAKQPLKSNAFVLDKDIKEVSDNFNTEKSNALSPFLNTGIMIDSNVYTIKTEPDYKGPVITLGDILLPEEDVPAEYYVSEEDLPKWKYLKGAKHEPRVNKTTGYTYQYSEGGMAFPDPLDKPSRTIITGEGGKAPSRFKHIVEVIPGKFRRLTPVELERLNGFPDNHTKGSTDLRRAFLMGNALVIPVVEKIGKSLIDKINEQEL